MKASEPKTVYMKPSIFTQMEIQEQKQKLLEDEDLQKKREKKTKEFNVYGRPRQKNEQQNVPCLLRSNPKSELNQKYILTDCLTDNRLKISSMHTRMYLKAPSINEVRNTGAHALLAKTIDKRNNLGKPRARRPGSLPPCPPPALDAAHLTPFLTQTTSRIRRT